MRNPRRARQLRYPGNSPESHLRSTSCAPEWHLGLSCQVAGSLGDHSRCSGDVREPKSGCQQSSVGSLHRLLSDSSWGSPCLAAGRQDALDRLEQSFEGKAVGLRTQAKGRPLPDFCVFRGRKYDDWTAYVALSDAREQPDRRGRRPTLPVDSGLCSQCVIVRSKRMLLSPLNRLRA